MCLIFDTSECFLVQKFIAKLNKMIFLLIRVGSGSGCRRAFLPETRLLSGTLYQFCMVIIFMVFPMYTG